MVTRTVIHTAIQMAINIRINSIYVRKLIGTKTMNTKFLSLLMVAPTAAFAHTGDHSNITSALGHAFSSVEHAALSLAVVAAITATLGLAGRIKMKVQAKRAK